MKKTFVTLFAILAIGITVSLANERKEIDPKIISAFQKEFSFAKNVKWEVKGDLTQVNFLLNEQGITAWYDADAVLVTIARNILYMQLPISVIKTLETDYADASLYGIVEITHNNDTYYRITGERKNKKFLLEATPSGYISVFKKIK
jgi:hypothetical protein